jgi:hypothetical protein
MKCLRIWVFSVCSQKLQLHSPVARLRLSECVFVRSCVCMLACLIVCKWVCCVYEYMSVCVYMRRLDLHVSVVCGCDKGCMSVCRNYVWVVGGIVGITGDYCVPCVQIKRMSKSRMWTWLYVWPRWGCAGVLSFICVRAFCIMCMCLCLLAFVCVCVYVCVCVCVC